MKEFEFLEALMDGAVVAFGAASVALGVISGNAAVNLPIRQTRRRKGRRYGRRDAKMEILKPTHEQWAKWLKLRAALIDAYCRENNQEPDLLMKCDSGRVRLFAMPDFETAYNILQFAPTGDAQIRGRDGAVSRFRITGKSLSADVFGALPSKIRRTK